MRVSPDAFSTAWLRRALCSTRAARASIGALVLFWLSGISLDAQVPNLEIEWSHPKIPAAYAEILQQRGQLELVDSTFAHVAYCPWIRLSSGEYVLSYSELAGDERVAYIVKDRSDSEIADTLFDLAQKASQVDRLLQDQISSIRNRSPAQEPPDALQRGSSTPDAELTAAATEVPQPRPHAKVITPAAVSIPAAPERTISESSPARDVRLPIVVLCVSFLGLILAVVIMVNALFGSPKPKIEASAISTPDEVLTQDAARVKLSPSTVVNLIPERPVPAKPGSVSPELCPSAVALDRMVADLKRMESAFFVNATKKTILREVGNRTEVMESYRKYFESANGMLRARGGLERTGGEIRDFGFSEAIRQGETKLALASQQTQMAKAEFERVQFEKATQALVNPQKAEPSAPSKTPEREGYDI
jgi:hypothetical protein